MNNQQLQDLKKLLEREPYVLDWSREGIEDLQYTHNPSIATLGEPLDGVTFYLTHYPTCYRRGKWRLMVDIHGGPGHHKWGCFDEQDQPLRNYHNKECLLQEADSIARVMILDRLTCEQEMRTGKCEKCGAAAETRVKVLDRWAYWCGCGNNSAVAT